MPPALFALVIFGTGSLIYACAGLHHGPPTYAFHIAGMTGVYHNAQVWNVLFLLNHAIPRLTVSHSITLGQSLNLYVQVLALKMEDVYINLKIQGRITY
jgi:hypothetical protein